MYDTWGRIRGGNGPFDLKVPTVIGISRHSSQPHLFELSRTTDTTHHCTGNSQLYCLGLGSSNH